jgi:hypothetical protein
MASEGAMAKRADYADSLRDVYLALSLIPVAALHAGSYWLKESLERTSRLGTDVAAATALASRAPAGTDDPVADVLARDLIEAAGSYVRSIVRLPADAAIYFTDELERRRNALLRQIQPDAATDLEAYMEGELERLITEFDRLSVVARAEEGRTAGRRPGKVRRRNKLVDGLAGLRAGAQGLRDSMKPQRPDRVSLDVSPDRPLRALDVYKARTKIDRALREAEAILPGKRRRFADIRALVERRTAKAVSAAHRPARAQKGVQ